MDMQELWNCERRLWLEGAGAHDELLHPHAIMTFPPPAGMMQAAAIVESLRGTPPWTAVEMTERASSGNLGGIVIIAYRAEGRGPEKSYSAYCSSTYVRQDESWRIIQHQQTPIG